MIQVLERAFDILEYLALDPSREHYLSEIADRFGLNHSTCANIMKTLVTRGYVDQIGKKKGYKLGSQIAKLTHFHGQFEPLIRVAKGAMHTFTVKSKEGIILAVLNENLRIVIHDEPAENELQVKVQKEKEAYTTSTGRLLLAYESEERIEKFVGQYGLPESNQWPEIEDIEDLKTELARIRKKQISIQESPNHITGIAVPILKNEHIQAALGIYLPTSRYQGKVPEKLQEALSDLALQIQSQL